MLRRRSATASVTSRIAVVAAALALAGCADPPARMAANDPYQDCLQRGALIGNLPYSATMFYQARAIDRIWPAVKSPVAQCNELRSRGQL